MAKLSNDEKQFLKDLIQPVQPRLRLAWLLMVVSTLVFVFQAWILAHIFATWLQQQFAGQPLDIGVLWQWLGWLIACFIARPLLQFVRELISSKASLTVRTNLRKRLLTALATLGASRSQFGSDGSISSQVIEQTDALDGFISRFSVQKQVAASTPIILLLAVASQSWLAAGILLFTAPFVPIFMILIGKMTAKKSAEQFTALSQLSGRFLDWVRGMTTLKRMQATHIAERDLDHASEQYRHRTMDVLKIAFLNGAVLEFLSALCIALVAVYLGFGLMGILPWDKEHVPVQYFGALFILLLTPEFYLPLRQLGADYHAQSQAEGAVQSLLPLLKKADELAELQNSSNKSNSQNNLHNSHNSEDITRTPTTTASASNTQLAPSIRLTNLAIYNTIYPAQNGQAQNASADIGELEQQEAKQLAEQAKNKTKNQKAKKKANKRKVNTATKTPKNLEPIIRTRLAPTSFEVNAGERIALVGESGSGKSSLIQALMGFANYEGNISIDGTDHHQLNIHELRAHIGYLAQQVALLPMSIADNLRLADPTASDEKLIEVLKNVELYELIKRLPNGIHTQLGERGRGLSGGQQQRLGLAQLLLRDSKLWLLDEPTEHLDPDTAERIHALLEKMSQGKTVIWITHAVEQLNWLDKVIQIEALTNNQ